LSFNITDAAAISGFVPGEAAFPAKPARVLPDGYQTKELAIRAVIFQRPRLKPLQIAGLEKQPPFHWIHRRMAVLFSFLAGGQVVEDRPVQREIGLFQPGKAPEARVEMGVESGPRPMEAGQ